MLGHLISAVCRYSKDEYEGYLCTLIGVQQTISDTCTTYEQDFPYLYFRANLVSMQEWRVLVPRLGTTIVQTRPRRKAPTAWRTLVDTLAQHPTYYLEQDPDDSPRRVPRDGWEAAVHRGLIRREIEAWELVAVVRLAEEHDEDGWVFTIAFAPPGMLDEWSPCPTAQGLAWLVEEEDGWPGVAWRIGDRGNVDQCPDPNRIRWTDASTDP